MTDLNKLFLPDNIANSAKLLDKELLDKIGQEVSDGYDIDDYSRDEWKKANKEAIDLAGQITESGKEFPFKDPANVKYPLIATGSIQFAARAYPNFVQSPNVVRGLVVGKDEDGMKAEKAERIGQHMSYQLLDEMIGWEEDTDTMLTILPIIGCEFKKSWFSPDLGRNVSERRSAMDLVINYKAKSMETAPRITDIFTLYPNELEERIRMGVYLKRDYGTPLSSKDEGDEPSKRDPHQPHVFIEQHTWYDLDRDGYREPYIIVLHKDTKKVARIVPRFKENAITYRNGRVAKIVPDHYFTKFPFMPALDGSIYGSGFGKLLSPINKTIDSLINQLLDSGTLYNANAGFLGKGIQLGRGRGGGKIDFKLGEWKHVGFVGDDLRKNIVPLPVKEPSAVLFNLLGFMVDAGERLSSVTEILTGDQSNTAERPTTTLARIEQGLKVFSSIHKRLYRSFREEFKKLFKLNSIYLEDEQYFNILDDPKSVARQDYDYRTCDVVPVADKDEVTNTQKLIKAQIWMGMQGQGYNDGEIRRRFAEAMQEPEPEKLLQAPAPPPDPKIVLEQQKLELEKDKFHFEMIQFMAEEDERTAKVASLLAKAEQSLAQAESIEPGQQLDHYRENLKAIVEVFKAKQGGTSGNNQGRVGSVENK